MVYNTSSFVYKTRMNLIKRIQKEGFNVTVISPVDEYTKNLIEHGINHYPIKMSQYGMNPFNEIQTIYQIWKAFKQIQPTVSLHYTIKPNTYGNIAARLAGVPVINNIAGAGKAFSDKNKILLFFVENLFRISLKNSCKVFFQNYDDMNHFIGRRLVSRFKAERIPGSGVDLKKFRYFPPVAKNHIQFLFLARLLKQKGISEFLLAASEIKKTYNNAKFVIVGEHENYNDYISKEILDEFCDNETIIYKGTVSPDDIPSILQESDCVVLPSYYREGVPRSLLEAAAMGKPIITTHNIGCKEVVDDGINGFKCDIKDVQCLIDSMKKILSMTLEQREKMGLSGRKKIEKEFDERIVIEKYITTIYQIINKEKSLQKG